jgi:multiple sugar transport system ATP-binding protein
MAGVVLDGVSKTYPGGVQAVREVSISIADGEFVVLVGPSGCGKTTTLRMIAGLEDVTDGEIRIGDRVVNDVEPKDRDIAMVFQNYALYPHMTVYNNMAFGLKLRKMPRREIKKRVTEAAETLGIAPYLNRKPKALSGGQRQRVALGRAIVRDPQVFLFDEPLSNLDAMLRMQTRAELKRLHARLRATMIYVTHDQVEAMTMGDRIVVMLDGEVQQIATPTEIYARPVNKFVAGFIGSPPMNFIDGEVREARGALEFVSDGIALPIPAVHRALLDRYVKHDVILGLRPEDLTAETAATPGSIEALVEVVEPLGSETHVYARAGEKTLIARLDARTDFRMGLPCSLGVHMDRAHFFDPDSSDAIV